MCLNIWMIIVYGQTYLSEAISDEFITSARKSVPLSRAENGNLAYAISRDILDPHSLHLMEIWDSEESLSLHSSSPHQMVRRQELENLKVSWREIKRYIAEP